MRTLVVYTSKYGSTKQYAEWIAERLDATLQEARGTTKENLATYDIVICGCYLHIGRYVGIDFLKDNWDSLKDKKVALFTISGAPPGSAEQETWYTANVPEEIRTRIRHFAMQGRAMNLDYVDRMLLAFPRMMLWMKHLMHPTPENKNAMRTFKPFDGVKKEYIEPLLEYVRAN